MEVLTTAENIKIAINFRHNVKVKNSTYFECLREKRKRRSEFVLHAQTVCFLVPIIVALFWLLLLSVLSS